MQIELVLVSSINILVSLISLKLAYRMSNGESVLYSPLLQIVTFHIVFTLIGAHFFAYDSGFLLHVINKKTIEDSQLNYALQMGFVAPFLVLGAYFSGLLFNFKPKLEVWHYQQREMQFNLTTTSNYFLILYLLFFFFLVLNFYFTKLNGFPIVIAVLNLIAGADSGLAEARSNVNYIIGFPGWLVQIVRYIIPAICLVIFLNLSNSKNKFVHYFGRWFLIFISFFLLISNGERMPLLMYVICIIVAMNFLKSSRNGLMRLIYILVFIVVFLGGFSVLLGRSSENSNVLEGIVRTIGDVFFRIFLSQAQTGSYIFQLFGDGRDFALTDIYVQNISTYVVDNVNSYSVDLFYLVHGRAGSASHSAFAEAYASFGTLGIMFVSFFLGMLCQYIFIKMIRMEKSILNSVFFSFLCISFSISALGSITGIIYNGLGAIIFVYFTIKITQRALIALKK